MVLVGVVPWEDEDGEEERREMQVGFDFHFFDEMEEWVRFLDGELYAKVEVKMPTFLYLTFL